MQDFLLYEDGSFEEMARLSHARGGFGASFDGSRSHDLVGEATVLTRFQRADKLDTPLSVRVAHAEGFPRTRG